MVYYFKDEVDLGSDVVDTWFPIGEVRVFAYGTLTSEEVLQQVIGRRWTGKYEPATLYGYQQLNTLPRFIVPAEDSIVEGVIIRDLDAGDLVAIDHYEGVEVGMYERIEVTVGGRKCYTYIMGPAVYWKYRQIDNLDHTIQFVQGETSDQSNP